MMELEECNRGKPIGLHELALIVVSFTYYKLIITYYLSNIVR